MIKVSFIVSLGLAAEALLRSRSAALRHWVLAAAIAAAGLTPILEVLLPSWSVPIGAASSSWAVSSWSVGAIEPLKLFVPIAVRDATEGVPVVQDESHDPFRRGSALGVLRLTWMMGVVFNLSILLIGLGRLAWLASMCRPVASGLWTQLTDALSREYGLRRRVVLLQSDHPTLLVTWGFRQPKVILPTAAGTWPDDRVRVVLGHELAHIGRHDWVVQMTAELLRSVYWFNPLVWMACRRLRQESEQACDDAVLGLGVDGSEYAAHLLDLARAFKRHRAIVFPAPAMAWPSSLERRVSAMLNARLNRTPITRAACLAIATALIAVAVPIAALVGAQPASSTFSGSLVDAVGRVLPATTIILVNAQSKEKHEALSDASGRFAFSALPAGEYLLQAQLPGFATSQGRVSLEAGQNLVRQVALQVGDIHETIRVTRPQPGSAQARAPVRRSAAMRTPSDSDDPCSQSAVGGCITPPLKIADVKPIYPARQRDAGIGGTVELDARMGTDGFVKDFRVTAPADPDFVNAAIEAIRQWQFTSPRLNGVPIEVSLHVSVSFVAE